MGSIYCLGGFPSDARELGRLAFNSEPSAAEVELFESALREGGIMSSGWWLTPEGSLAVVQRIRPKLCKLRAAIELDDPFTRLSARKLQKLGMSSSLARAIVAAIKAHASR